MGKKLKLIPHYQLIANLVIDSFDEKRNKNEVAFETAKNILTSIGVEDESKIPSIEFYYKNYYKLMNGIAFSSSGVGAGVYTYFLQHIYDNLGKERLIMALNAFKPYADKNTSAYEVYEKYKPFL